MPLVGIIDPSHEERALDEPGRYPRWLTTEAMLTKSAEADPKWSPWPYEMLKSAVDAYQERDYISVTMLTGGCARGKVLERREDFLLNVDVLYASLRGTQLHRTLEDATRPGALAEWRFFTSVLHTPAYPAVELSCSPDLLVYDGPHPGIADWKVTENPPTFGYPWKSHTRQLQYNAYVVRHAERWLDEYGDPGDLPFDNRAWNASTLYIVYLGPKGPKVIECQTTRETTAPNGNRVKRKMPDVWDDEQVEADMVPRLRGMVRALESYPEWPDGLEDAPGFEGPPGWACPGPPLCYSQYTRIYK
jgi:hypothetical protein